MSGGSFNYLHSAALNGELGSRTDDLQRMAGWLQQHNYAPEATAVLELLQSIERTRELGMALLPVFRAVEWHTSGDWSMEAVQEASKKYRADHPPCPKPYPFPATTHRCDGCGQDCGTCHVSRDNLHWCGNCHNDFTQYPKTTDDKIADVERRLGKRIAKLERE